MGRKVERRCVNSGCGRISRKRRHKICPVCGARMEENSEAIHAHLNLNPKNKNYKN